MVRSFVIEDRVEVHDFFLCFLPSFFGFLLTHSNEIRLCGKGFTINAKDALSDGMV